MLPEDSVVTFAVAAFKHRHQGFAFERDNLFALVHLWVLCAGDVGAGGHKVNDVARLVSDFLLLFYHGGPVCDERSCDSAFMYPVFEESKRRIGGVCPGVSVALVCVGRARHYFREVTDADGTAIGSGFVNDVVEPGIWEELFVATAVVGEEQDEGVFEVVFECVQYSADAGIHLVDLSGVDLHSASVPIVVFGSFPWANFSVSWRERPFGIDKAHFNHVLVAFGTELVPAGVVSAFVFLDVFIGGVEGPVRRGICNVHEEWFVRVGLEVLGDKGGRVVTDGVGVVEVFGFGLNDFVVPDEALRVEVRTCTGDGTVESVEATFARPDVPLARAAGVAVDGADVPLADHIGAVAGGLEGLCDGDAAVVKVALVRGAAFVVGHVPDASLVGVETCEQ